MTLPRYTWADVEAYGMTGEMVDREIRRSRIAQVLFLAVFVPFSTAAAQPERPNIPELWRACREPVECGRVYRDCGDCCGFESINLKFEKEHRAWFRQRCPGNEEHCAAAADMSCSPATITCREGRCSLVRLNFGGESK